MRLKTELYEKEQNDLSNKFIDILELDDENSNKWKRKTKLFM